MFEFWKTHGIKQGHQDYDQIGAFLNLAYTLLAQTICSIDPTYIK